MVQSHQTIFFAHTDKGRWGKGMTLESALENAGASMKTNCLITIITVRFEASDEEIRKILMAYSVDGYGNISVDLSHLSQDDSEQIIGLLDKYVQGFITMTGNFRSITL